MDYPDIIPYNTWINSQFSIARHYGGMQMNWKYYVVDYIFAPEGQNWLCKPDLIEDKLYQKMKKERKAEVKAFEKKVKEEAKKLHQKKQQELLEKQQDFDGLPY